jgi:hypothetical protein
MTDPESIIMVEDAQWTSSLSAEGTTVELTMDTLLREYLWLDDGVIIPYREREL